MNDDNAFIETLENASDYLPEYGEVYNESGLADIYLGHLFGIGQRSESCTTIRPVFLTRKEA